MQLELGSAIRFAENNHNRDNSACARYILINYQIGTIFIDLVCRDILGLREAVMQKQTGTAHLSVDINSYDCWDSFTAILHSSSSFHLHGICSCTINASQINFVWQSCSDQNFVLKCAPATLLPIHMHTGYGSIRRPGRRYLKRWRRSWVCPHDDDMNFTTDLLWVTYF